MPEPDYDPPPEDAVDAALAAAFGPAVADDTPADRRADATHAGPRANDTLSFAVSDPPHAHAGRLPTLVGRYEVLGEVARGGMGAVLRCRDAGLGRELAVKVLLDAHRNDPAMVRRFREEARVCGRLQHPGVPPVHEFGWAEDGRPFFAMRLVRGRTLDALLSARPTPDADRPHLLRTVLRVCETVAYAHSVGVVHRDLKPTNVMVGAFGEVQVMDWGLAKNLAGRERERPESGNAPAVHAPGPPGSGHTEAGAVLGTPSYMPPEQARGESARVDERADVFGLGGLLCVLLTGAPPHRGPNARRRAEAGDVSDALVRLAAVTTDADLAALAGQCLSPSPADRPRDAAAVAAAVADHMARAEEKLRRAELAEAEARAAAASERRRRRLGRAVAAGAAIAVLLAAAGVLWANHDWQTRRADRTARLEAALAETDRLWGRAQTADPRDATAWERAAAAADAAKAALAGGEVDPAAADRAARVFADLEAEAGRATERAAVLARDDRMTARLDDILLRRADRSDTVKTGGRSDDDYRRAFAEYGVDPDRPDEAAEAVRASGIRSALLAALDDWAFETDRPATRERALAVARLADPDPAGWSARFRDAMVFRGDPGPLLGAAAAAEWADRYSTGSPPRDWPRLRALAAADTAGVSTIRLTVLGSALTKHGDAAAAERLLRAVRRRHPGDFWANLELGNCLAARSRLDEAARYYTAAVALRPASAGGHLALGNTLGRLGRNEDAAAAYRTAVEARSDFGPGYLNLSGTLVVLGRWADAAAAAREAVRLMPDSVGPLSNLSVALRQLRRYADAEAAATKAVALEPKSVLSHENLAAALYSQGRFAASVAEYRVAQGLAAKPGGGDADLIVPGRAAGFDPQWLRKAERAIDLDRRFPALLGGGEKPTTAAEQVEWAKFAQQFRKRYALAAGLYSAAHAADPKLVANPQTGNRFNAVCVSALAGCGEGIDAPSDDAARTALRAQARTWLASDLELLLRLAQATGPDAGPVVVQLLGLWEADDDLRGVRGAALDHLPPDQRAAWAKLWADVAAARRAHGPPDK